MAKRTRNESPRKQAMREMMKNYLKGNDVSVKNGGNVNAVMGDMMSVLLEGALDEELNEDLDMTIATREQTIAERVIHQKLCILLMAMWILYSQRI